MQETQAQRAAVGSKTMTGPGSDAPSGMAALVADTLSFMHQKKQNPQYVTHAGHYDLATPFSALFLKRLTEGSLQALTSLLLQDVI